MQDSSIMSGAKHRQESARVAYVRKHCVNCYNTVSVSLVEIWITELLLKNGGIATGVSPAGWNYTLIMTNEPCRNPDSLFWDQCFMLDDHIIN